MASGTSRSSVSQREGASGAGPSSSTTASTPRGGPGGGGSGGGATISTPSDQASPTLEYSALTPLAEFDQSGHGHYFSKKTFHKPTYCHHCTDMLWGLIGQGYICGVCNFVVHERCLKIVVSPCSTVASNVIKVSIPLRGPRLGPNPRHLAFQNPVPHCWTETSSLKRKFCNVCRKRIEDHTALRCEVCEYCVHTDCQDFSVPDCKECATYVPDQELVCRS